MEVDEVNGYAFMNGVSRSEVPAGFMTSMSMADYMRFQEQYPLHVACRNGDAGLLERLIDEGKHNIIAEDCVYGWRPAHWAAYFGKVRCLMLVVDRGGHFDTGGGQSAHGAHSGGLRPSHCAAWGGHGYCLKWLLHCGALTSPKDYIGDTPLHKAARVGSMECVSLLTAHGADTSLKNQNGQTAADVARMCDQSACAEYLSQSACLVGRHGLDSVMNECYQGLPPAMTNGHSVPHNGFTNGHTEMSNGFTNGHTEVNGFTNGHVTQNGLTNGEHDTTMTAVQHAAFAGRKRSFGSVELFGGKRFCPGDVQNGVSDHVGPHQSLTNGYSGHTGLQQPPLTDVTVNHNNHIQQPQELQPQDQPQAEPSRDPHQGMMTSGSLCHYSTVAAHHQYDEVLLDLIHGH